VNLHDRQPYGTIDEQMAGSSMKKRSSRSTYSAYRRYMARADKSGRAWRRRQARLPIEQKLAIVVELQTLNYEIGRAQGEDRPLPWGMAS